jgi:hypothetical protein
MVSSEFSSIERDWVIETVYQGAYLRQYHLTDSKLPRRHPNHRSGMAGPNTPPAETNSDAERPTAWLG